MLPINQKKGIFDHFFLLLRIVSFLMQVDIQERKKNEGTNLNRCVQVCTSIPKFVQKPQRCP